MGKPIRINEIDALADGIQSDRPSEEQPHINDTKKTKHPLNLNIPE